MLKNRREIAGRALALNYGKMRSPFASGTRGCAKLAPKKPN